MDETKRKILEAAGREFADRGFEGATVRAICERAGVNLAAINYHFGGKEALYERAVLHAARCGSGPEAMPIDLEMPAEELLRGFIWHFLEDVVSLEEEDRWENLLMVREMTRPSAVSETLAREVIGPRFHLLREILRRLAPGADPLRVTALGFSVVGQCLFYRLAGAMAERLAGAETMGRLDVEYLTRHITGVVLAAIRDGEGGGGR
jgi:AcrR family transcriptional regulator